MLSRNRSIDPILDEVYYDILKVANYLDTSRETIERQIESKEIIGVRIGCKWKIKGSDLKNYIFRNTSK